MNEASSSYNVSDPFVVVRASAKQPIQTMAQ